MGIVHLAGPFQPATQRQDCSLCGTTLPPADPGQRQDFCWPVDSLVTVTGNQAIGRAERGAIRCSRSLLVEDDAA